MVGVKGETQQAPEHPKPASQPCFRNGKNWGGRVAEDKDRTEGGLGGGQVGGSRG